METVATIAALRLNYGQANGTYILVKENNYLYQYNSTSTTADDGTAVIRPVMTNAGRWLKVEHYASTKINSLKTVAKNVTANLTVAEVLTGVITSTSEAAVTLTLPTAAAIQTATGATAGTFFDLFIDNSGGAQTVTVAVNTGITTITPAITGGSVLTVSTSNKVACFRILFVDTANAYIMRIF